MKNLMREFYLFAEQISLPSSLSEKVLVFLQDFDDAFFNSCNKTNQKVLFACCIYIIIQDDHSSEQIKTEENILQSFTVSKLLESAGMSIMDFFTVTCLLKKHHHLSDSSKQSLIALERKYLIVSALFDKFENMIGEIFCAEDNSTTEQASASSSNPELKDLLKQYKALCWMLFIVAKAKIFWHRQELLATFHLLLCCIAEVVKSTPTFLLLPPFDTAVAKNEDSLTILKVLSNHVKTKFEEVAAVHDGWLHVANELIVDSKLPELDCLQDIYSQLYLQSGDIDESQFLNHDWHLLPQNSEQSSSPRKQNLSLVRRTLDTAEALNKILLSIPDDIPITLKNILQKCARNGYATIKDFISKSEKEFVEAFLNAQEGGNKNLALKRFQLAVRYYYIMLEALLKKEAERLPIPEFTSLITNMPFHKSLLSCCLEITLMSCGNVSSVFFTPLVHGGNSQSQGVAFPWILNVFNLEPFYFFKIIPSFIRTAPTITSQIIKHLKEIEDKILEHLAWQSGSSLFNALSGLGCSPTCKAVPDTSKSLIKLWSPTEGGSHSSGSSPTLCHAVNLFLNKVSRLAYHRLEKLCTVLEISKDTLSSIWTCLEHVIYKKHNLLKDRHLDQMNLVNEDVAQQIVSLYYSTIPMSQKEISNQLGISYRSVCYYIDKHKKNELIMCCIFGVCKVLEQDVKFKAIVSCYSRLPNTSVSTYKYVLSEGRKDYIITFYNKEFYTEMKDFILTSFGNKNKIESSPTLKSLQSPLKLSPSFSLPGKKNIFISPLKQSPFKNPNEVMNKLFPSYSVGSLTQSPKTLKTINDTLNVLHPSKKADEVKGKKRLFSDEDPGTSKEYSSAKKILKFDDEPESTLENSGKSE